VSKRGHAASKAGPPGDLMITIKVKPHKLFKREGFDIHTDVFISVSQAVLGSDCKVETLYGDVKIKLDSGTQHNEKKKLSNYGVQKLPPNHH